ncbi:hypothetical protein FSP39_004196 [Pinctada imbricata]|uniref:Rieske domain-containing protein n=1 Tax=Pinctada imbricata TaxID=66713 RepID=A0AA88XY03_PINIB|nr:hypothetical protein FSP39_004196 [Pinctada imbricata]
MAEWRMVGEVSVLQQKKCHHVYSQRHRTNDLVMFYKGEKFYAMGAWCSHMGGPLFKGDIEDYKGRCHVICPWHGYMFDLETGKNEIGIEQEVFEVKSEDGKVYILHQDQLSLTPFDVKEDTAGSTSENS